MASNSHSRRKESTGTVLLRQAEPKYKFVGRKLPKESNESGSSCHCKDENRNMDVPSIGEANSKSSQIYEYQTAPSSASTSKMLPNQNKFTNVNPVTPQGRKPVAIVGASLKSKSPPSSLSNTVYGERISSSISQTQPQSPVSLSQVLASPNPSTSSASNIQSQQSLPSPVPDQESNLTHGPLSTTAAVSPNYRTLSVSPVSSSQTFEDSLLVDDEEAPASVINTSAAAVALSGVTHGMLSKRLVEAEGERDKLKKDLDAQLQVNSELKRLLVASVGDDLSKRVERLAQDRVQLSMDIGGFSKKMNEDYENLDKMSIQADMWRSKYLASRVMVEELGNARAYFSLQWHESQDALQQMLNERHELRTNLLEAYKILQQVKDAFDPLNSHRSSTLTSTNVLDLSRACQQLGEAVRFRLLPAHVATTMSSVEIDLDSWSDSVTRAEQYAHELLSRPSEPSGSLHSGSSNLLPVAGPGSPPSCCSSPTSPRLLGTTTTTTHLHPHPHGHINRFHPQVRHENVTYHCCKCKGEIRVV